MENPYILSPKDLCTIGYLDLIVKTGVSVLKIEGRGRAPEYVKVVTKCYHEAVQAIEEGTYGPEKAEAWTERLRSVYNRDFWGGYYLGHTAGEWADRYGSQATHYRQRVGKITNFFRKLSVAEVTVEEENLNVGDQILIIGQTTGVYEDTVEEIRVDYQPATTAAKGVVCSIPVKSQVRIGDQLYKWAEREYIEL